MNEIPEVFAMFEQKLAHVLSFTIIAQRNNTKQAIEELLAYFSGIVERASKAEARIAELEKDNAEFRQLIHDWSIVLEQDYDFQLSHVESVRQAMLEINKESELREYIDELETEKECEMRVFKDGNAWCFVLPDFQDLQVSPSVWMKKGVLDKIYKELRSVR